MGATINGVTNDPRTAFDAAEEFRRARRSAEIRELLRSVGAQRVPLLSFDEVRRRLQAVEGSTRTLQDVPLDAIVGSVGRTVDFTREFLPLQDSDLERWVGVSVAMSGLRGVPPIELYRIGDAYFVRDGNHRVSVARQAGSKTIQAYVTPVYSRAPLPAGASPDDLIIAEEHAKFLEATALDRLRPDADLRVTTAGAFDALREHISVHRYFMGIDQKRPIADAEAVAHWYDAVYTPVVATVRELGVLRGFPGRTEADLYLWLSEHRGRLERETGFALTPQAIAERIAEERVQRPRFDDARREKLLREARAAGANPSIADDLLVAMPNLGMGVPALQQALWVARREGARIYALHVAADEAAASGSDVAALRDAAERAAAAEGVALQFAVAIGSPTAELRRRGAWVDAIVAPLTQPDPAGGWRLHPRYRGLMRRSPRPILAVAGVPRPLEHVLIAYDGGPRAQQALFAGAYAAAKWGARVSALHVGDERRGAQQVLEPVRRYLEAHGVEGDFIVRAGAVAETIAEVAAERHCSVVLMGSYRYSRWLESMLGGVLERTLRLVGRPVLIL